MGGGGGSKGPDKDYQRQQAREMDRLTEEENRRLRALQRGRLGRASLLSGLDAPGEMVVPGSGGGGSMGGRAGGVGQTWSGGNAPSPRAVMKAAAGTGLMVK